jgi:Family of unknown function (DUF6220)
MTDTTARRAAPGVRSGPHRAYIVVLTLFLVDGLLQIALAGWGAFSDDKDAFEPHEANAAVLAALALLAVVLAAVAREGTRAIGACVVLLLVVSPVQMLLASLGDDAAFWGALHALVGLGALGLAGFLHGRAIKGERV